VLGRRTTAKDRESTRLRRRLAAPNVQNTKKNGLFIGHRRGCKQWLRKWRTLLLATLAAAVCIGRPLGDSYRSQPTSYPAGREKISRRLGGLPGIRTAIISRRVRGKARVVIREAASSARCRCRQGRWGQTKQKNPEAEVWRVRDRCALWLILLKHILNPGEIGNIPRSSQSCCRTGTHAPPKRGVQGKSVLPKLPYIRHACASSRDISLGWRGPGLAMLSTRSLRCPRPARPDLKPQ